MAFVSREDLRTLLQEPGGCCVSIFMPTHRAGAEVLEGRIRLKNQLKEAREQLAQTNLAKVEQEALLEPAQALLTDSRFWQEQSDGLALFFGEAFFQLFRVPLAFEEQVVVGSRFHVKPLLPLFTGDGRFFILALSQNNVRLLQSTRYTVEEIEDAGLPANMAEALAEEDPEKQLQFHTSTAPSGAPGDRPAVFHGADPSEEEKEAIGRYFREIDKALRPWLQQEKAPLVLAGVNYLFPLYREVNSYAHLMEQGVSGNPDELRAETLHEEAWQIVEPHFARDREAAGAQFYELLARDMAAHDLESVVAAAHYGQIDTLFVATDRQQWGNFDSETGEMSLAAEQGPEQVDLLNETAVQTLLNGGVVYASPTAAIPGNKETAALFRYNPSAANG